MTAVSVSNSEQQRDGNEAATHSTALRDWRSGFLETIAAELSAAEMTTLKSQAIALATEPASTSEAGSAPARSTTPIIVRNTDQLAAMAAVLRPNTICAIDLETSDTNPRNGVIVAVGIATDKAVYYLPLQHRDDRGRLLPDQLTLADLTSHVPLAQLKLVAHNAKFEFAWLRRHAGVTCNIVWDTLLAARLLRSDAPADLESVAIRELDVLAWSLSKEDMTRMQRLPIDRVAAYCAKDCRYTLEIYRKQLKCLT